MNEKNIDKLLKEVSPRRASKGFKDELLREIREIHSAPAVIYAPVRQWRPAVLTAAAAVILLCLSLALIVPDGDQRQQPVQPGPPGTGANAVSDELDIYVPSRSETMLLSYEKEPLYLDDKTVDRHRFHLVDCVEWRNARTGNRYRAVLPREETIITRDNVL